MSHMLHERIGWRKPSMLRFTLSRFPFVAHRVRLPLCLHLSTPWRLPSITCCAGREERLR
ncbi:MAG TPA: hypothetical protein VE669_00125 [Actinomycetota bacterium]|nr:hypothetical protein [Actinomycetota bacterium]